MKQGRYTWKLSFKLLNRPEIPDSRVDEGLWCFKVRTQRGRVSLCMERGTWHWVLTDKWEFTSEKREKWLESEKSVRHSHDRVKLRRLENMAKRRARLEHSCHLLHPSWLPSLIRDLFFLILTRAEASAGLSLLLVFPSLACLPCCSQGGLYEKQILDC